jgi:hypothetical protein
VEQLLEVDGDLEVGLGGGRQDEAGVFGGDAGVHHLLVEGAQLPQGLLHLLCKALLLHRLRHRVGVLAFLEGHVALALLFEADADAVADELVAEGAAHTGDGELEPALFEGRCVAGLEAPLDELQHLLARDALAFDPLDDLLRRQRRVGSAIGHIKGLDRVVGMVQQVDLDSHEVPRSSGRRAGCARRALRPSQASTPER